MKSKKGMRVMILTGFTLLFIFVLLSGCVNDKTRPVDQLRLSEDEKAEAIRIACENTTVKMYTSGEYEITDVNYSVFQRAVGRVESSEWLPAVTIETEEAVVVVFLDLEKKTVVSIAKLYLRSPVIKPAAGDSGLPDATGSPPSTLS